MELDVRNQDKSKSTMFTQVNLVCLFSMNSDRPGECSMFKCTGLRRGFQSPSPLRTLRKGDTCLTYVWLKGVTSKSHADCTESGD